MDYQHMPLHRGIAEPLYRQIAAWFAAAIARGDLAPRQRLPPIRALARTIGVSQVTVTQAYEVLIAEGDVASHVGRGTFVVQRPAQDPEPVAPLAILDGADAEAEPGQPARDAWMRVWQEWQSSRPATPRQQWHTFMDEAMRRLPTTAAPIYLSDGVPDPALFAVRRWQRSMRLGAQAQPQALVAGDAAALQYGTALGDTGLRTYLAGALRRRGIRVSPDEILLTSGTQQGLELIARAFLAPNDVVVAEEVTYLSALDLFESHGVTWCTVPLDHDGLRVEVLAQRIGGAQPRPRLAYTIPTGHSPTGVTLSADRRQQLVRLAQERNLVLIADMVFDEFFLDEDGPPPPLASHAHDGRVISVLSFNKTVFPALRMGCLVADPLLIGALARTKALVDRGTSVPLARALWRHMDSPEYAREIEDARRHYRARRDHLLALLQRDLRPLGCQWTQPTAGFSLMLTLPPECPATQVVLAAASAGVLILPGSLFAPVPSSTWANALRLSYGNLAPAALDEAVRRLAGVLREVRRSGTRAGEPRFAHVVPQV